MERARSKIAREEAERRRKLKEVSEELEKKNILIVNNELERCSHLFEGLQQLEQLGLFDIFQNLKDYRLEEYHREMKGWEFYDPDDFEYPDPQIFAGAEVVFEYILGDGDGKLLKSKSDIRLPDFHIPRINKLEVFTKPVELESAKAECVYLGFEWRMFYGEWGFSTPRWIRCEFPESGGKEVLQIRGYHDRYASYRLNDTTKLTSWSRDSLEEAIAEEYIRVQNFFADEKAEWKYVFRKH